MLFVISCYFCFHEQVNESPKKRTELWLLVFSFNCFSSFEALQGVHWAREERKENGRNFSVRNTVDLSYQNPSDTRSAREIEIWTKQILGWRTRRKVLSRSRNPFQGRSEGPAFEDLEGILSLKWVKSHEEECETLQSVGSSEVVRRLVTGKRSDRRSGGHCEPLIKRLKLSEFRQTGVQGSTVWDSRQVEPWKDRSC